MDNQPVEKCFCLSVDSVSYGRAPVRGWHDSNQANRDINTPTHQLVVRDLKGAWTESNRDVAFALFDTFMKNKVFNVVRIFISDVSKCIFLHQFILIIIYNYNYYLYSN